MAAQYIAQGGAVAVTTSCAPAYPAGIAAGDVAVASVSSDSTTAPATPGGWTHRLSTTGSGMTLHTYTRTLTGSETGTVSFTGITGGTKGAAYIAAYEPATPSNVLTYIAITSGTDSDTSSTAFSATGSSWTVTTDDRIVAPAVSLAPSGSYAGSWSGQTVSNAGATLSSTARFGGRTGTNTISYGLQDASVSSGGTGAPTVACTCNGANGAGVAHFIQIRESTSTSTDVTTTTVAAVAAVGGASSPTGGFGDNFGISFGTGTGSATLATVTAVASVGTPTYAATGSATASTVAAVASVGVVTQSGSATPTGATVAAVASVPGVTRQASTLVTITTVTATAGVGTPSVSGGSGANVTTTTVVARAAIAGAAPPSPGGGAVIIRLMKSLKARAMGDPMGTNVLAVLRKWRS